MKRRTLGEIVSLMGGQGDQLVGDENVVVGPDVVIDNREATPGALFVAIPGARVDGHAFAGAAAEAGALAVLGTRSGTADVPHIVCEDTIASLSRLARGIVLEARDAGLVSIGITGSSGKTSTKDLLAQVLESAGQTVAPIGSQNNEIGVPLTACRVDELTKFLVSEMGARGPGHIEWLVSLMGPSIGIVLNVGTAHMGEFGSIEQTATAKRELVEGLPEDGWAVLNANDALVTAMATHTKASVAWFGEGDLPPGRLQVRAINVTTNKLSQRSFDLEVTRDGDTEKAHVDLRLVGSHQVSNALAAAAGALAAGLDVTQVADALSQAAPRSDWRMDLLRRGDGALILNDSYNANPDSMAAALRTTAELGQNQRNEYPGARLIAVLGDMLELGPLAAEMHASIGRLAADLGIDEVVAVGDHAADLAQAAQARGLQARVMERDQVSAAVALKAGDVVLVKGSRGIGLETVAKELFEGKTK